MTDDMPNFKAVTRVLARTRLGYLDEPGLPRLTALLSDAAPSPAACPDCHDVVFPGATVCDGCGAHLNPERTPDGN